MFSSYSIFILMSLSLSDICCNPIVKPVIFWMSENSRWAWHEMTKHPSFGNYSKGDVNCTLKKKRKRKKDSKQSSLSYSRLRSYMPWTRITASFWTPAWTTLGPVSCCCWEPGWCQDNAGEVSLLLWGTCRAWHNQHNMQSKTFC